MGMSKTVKEIAYYLLERIPRNGRDGGLKIDAQNERFSLKSGPRYFGILTGIGAKKKDRRPFSPSRVY